MTLERFVSLAVGLDDTDNNALWMTYHENTKLTLETAERSRDFGSSGYELFVSSRGFKQYRDVPRVALSEGTSTEGELGKVIASRRSSREVAAPVTLDALGSVLQQSFGPTAVVRQRDRDVVQALRAWPSAGGLYPIDIYVVAARVNGLQRGIYHYNAITAELERMPLRDAPEAVLGRGFFRQEFAVGAAVGLLMVAAFDRTIAKYGERGYRLVLLDAGHAAQNVLLTAADLDLRAVPIAGFCDDALAEDLDLDGVHEAVVHTVLIGGGEDGSLA